MNTHLSLEEKRELPKNRLDENLQKKRAMELQTNQQFENLKKSEISLEKYAFIIEGPEGTHGQIR
jgi:hypothetical protein